MDAQHHPVHSYDVFLHYIHSTGDRDDDDGVDVSRVFSRECFEAWVATRREPPKKPEESFRKALVAHCAGRDDRQPFEPAVERQLLARMRRKETWPAFVHNTDGTEKIGMRGIKSQGYHERLREKSSSNNTACSSSSASSSSQKAGFVRAAKRQKTLYEENDKVELEAAESMLTPFFEGGITGYENNQKLYVESFLRLLDDLDREFDAKRGDARNSVMFAHALLKSCTRTELRKMAISTFKSNIDLISQKLCVKMDICPRMNGALYSESFICPTDPAECQFDPFLPIGRFIRSTSGLIARSDVNSNMMHGGNLEGQPATAFLVSAVHSRLAYSFMFKRKAVDANKAVYIRNLVWVNGEIRVMKGCLITDDEKKAVLYEQDETDRFKHLLIDGLVFV